MKLRREVRSGGVDVDPADPPPAAITADEALGLARTFAPPVWLRDLGRASWLLVGLGLLIVGATVLLGLTATIVEPVLVGLVVSTVASPIVSALVPHHLPRPAGAAIVLVGLLALAVLMGILVVGGITSQAGPIGSYAERAADKAAGWLEDAGVSSTGAADVKQSAETDVPSVIATLTSGVAKTIQTLTSLAFFLSFTLFSIFFLLKDGPKMRRWIDRHLGVPTAAAQVITAT